MNPDGRTSIYFDKAGRPISVYEWSRLFDDPVYRVVAKTKVGEPEVSTVWLGIDHGHGRAPHPILFETLVFPECKLMWRYATEDEARVGHEQAVAGLRRG